MAYIGNQPLATAVTNADISSSAAIDLSKLATSGDLSATNVTLGGYLRGPSTFTIDPAAHGDNTGTLVIAGNLQVDGLTTTVNSTTMTVDDKNITVASGAANAAAADGAGITVDGASATLLYNATPDAWSFNKKVGINTTAPANTFVVAEGTNQHGIEFAPGTTSYIQAYDRATSDYGDLKIDGQTIAFGTDNGVTKMVINSSGLVGIGTSSPTDSSGFGTALDISGTGGAAIYLRDSTDSKLGLVGQWDGELSINSKQSDGTINFYINSGSKMKIDSSGNVLVNTTDTQPPTNNDAHGIALRTDGKIAASRSNGISGDFNTGANGDLIWFRRAGTHSGRLGVSGGSGTEIYLYANSGKGLLLNNNGLLASTSSGGGSNNTTDLGQPDVRWKDLYLGGGVVDTTTTVSYASSIALSYTNGAIQTVTLTGNATFTDSLNDGEAIVLMLNGGASHTVTWTAVTKWVTGSGNAAPTLTASDAIILWKIGSAVYAATAGSFA